MSETIPKQAENYLEALANALELPRSRYEQAEKSYKSLGEWLHRDDSQIRNYDPDVFVQGSFRLGTAIKPQSEIEEYDIDSVCVLRALSKSDFSQARLKELVGDEVKLYRIAKGMTKKVQESRRCWRLEYADGAQFHMDVLPSLPNARYQRRLLEARDLDVRFADTAIAITDNKVPEYSVVTEDWPRSNPRGYADWFTERMGDVFVRRREMVLNEMRVEGVTASIEDIPVYRVRTPLQSAIMILKRHRDTMFAADPTIKPISIIISTLSGHAYNGEETIGAALLSILIRMENMIEHDGVGYVIKNPTDPLENFADKWSEVPERAAAFFDWLKHARTDFAAAASLVEYQRMSDVLADGLGRELAQAATDALLQSSRPGGRCSLVRAATVASAASPAPVSFADTPRVPKKPEGFA